jgi:hypothetical protein
LSPSDDIDYDEDIARRWWFKTRSVPLLVDTRVSAGHPITADTGVRLDAIASRHRDGYSARETRQQPWEAFRARVGLTGLPERFSDVVDGVVDFIDGLQAENVSRWNPPQRRWE